MTGATGEPAPFLSSYIEALAAGQEVASGQNFVFDLTPGDIDIVGTDIEVQTTAEGTVFTIQRAGLYHVEWSVNLESAAGSVVLCLQESGELISPIACAALSGNISSGALINVTDGDLPVEISLHNFGDQIVVASAPGTADTAASFRILRFADGPN